MSATDLTNDDDDEDDDDDLCKPLIRFGRREVLGWGVSEIANVEEGSKRPMNSNKTTL